MKSFILPVSFEARPALLGVLRPSFLLCLGKSPPGPHCPSPRRPGSPRALPPAPPAQPPPAQPSSPEQERAPPKGAVLAASLVGVMAPLCRAPPASEIVG